MRPLPTLPPPPTPSTTSHPPCSVPPAQTNQAAVLSFSSATPCAASAQFVHGGRKAIYPAPSTHETQAGVYTADTLPHAHYATTPAESIRHTAHKQSDDY